MRAPDQPSPATGAVVRALREAGAPGPGTDRFLAPEIETAVRLVANGVAVTAAEAVTGPLS
jgi:histidine ammonia-lyase